MNAGGIHVEEITVEDALALRNDVLRPGYDRSDCIFAGDYDADTRHFGALDGKGNIVGILSVYRRGNPAVGDDEGDSYQIRAMATKPGMRGRGIGDLLIARMETHVLGCGGHWLWANARSEAIAFYRKAGYQVVSGEFMIDPIGPHYLICKHLQ